MKKAKILFQEGMCWCCCSVW